MLLIIFEKLRIVIQNGTYKNDLIINFFCRCPSFHAQNSGTQGRVLQPIHN